MGYAHILTITFNHGFFSDGWCPALKIQPTRATEKQFNNNGILWKSRQNKFRLFADKSYLDPLPVSASTLFLCLYTASPQFFIYTDINPHPGLDFIYKKAGPLTQNAQLTIGDNDLIRNMEALIPLMASPDFTKTASTVTLPDGSTEPISFLAEFFSSSDKRAFDEGVYQLDGTSPSSGKYLLLHDQGWNYPPGCLEVSIKELADEWQDHQAPRELTINLPARQVYWCYHLISDDPEKLKASTLKMSDASATFRSEEISDFKSGEKLVRICTEEKIRLKQRYPFSIELRNSQEPSHVTRLPYPSADALSVVKRGEEAELCTDTYYYL